MVVKNIDRRDIVHVVLRTEGETNYNWTITLKDGTERHFYSIDQEVPLETSGDDEEKVPNKSSEGSLCWLLFDWIPSLGNFEDKSMDFGTEWDIYLKDGVVTRVIQSVDPRDRSHLVNQSED